MNFDVTGIGSIATGVAGLGQEILKRIWPDPEKRAEAEAALAEAEKDGRLASLNTELSAIIMEAKSQDPWTSRARPTFLYVVYVMILASVPMGFLSAISPDTAKAVATGMEMWLGAIPDDVWWLFGVGYLGYTGARSFDKRSTLKAKTTVATQQTGPTLRDRLF